MLVDLLCHPCTFSNADSQYSSLDQPPDYWDPKHHHQSHLDPTPDNRDPKGVVQHAPVLDPAPERGYGAAYPQPHVSMGTVCSKSTLLLCTVFKLTTYSDYYLDMLLYVTMLLLMLKYSYISTHRRAGVYVNSCNNMISMPFIPTCPRLYSYT